MTKKDMLTMVSVRADGTVSEEQIHVSDLSALQRAVGGYIEVVPGLEMFEHKGAIHKCVAFCDEEGKLKGKPVNVKATEIWNRGLAEKGVRRNPDVLHGDVAFVFGDPKVMVKL